MTMERVDTSLCKPQTSAIALTSLSGHSTGSSFANANSYLKSRRVAAKKNRHSDILNFLDSSVDSGTDFLTQISGQDNVDVFGTIPVASKPTLPTSIKTKKKKKSKATLGGKKSKSAVPTKKRPSDASLSQEASIEDILDRLESETGHVSVCSLDTMSSTSLGFDSSSHHLQQGRTWPQHEMGNKEGHSSSNLNGSASSFFDCLVEFNGDHTAEYTTIKARESPVEPNSPGATSSSREPISKEYVLRMEERKRQKEEYFRLEEEERRQQEESWLDQDCQEKVRQDETTKKEAEHRAMGSLQMVLQEQKRKEQARIEREQKVKEEREQEATTMHEERRKEEEQWAWEQTNLEQEQMVEREAKERATTGRLEEQKGLSEKPLEEEIVDREILAKESMVEDAIFRRKGDHLREISSPEIQEDETEQSDSSYTEEEFFEEDSSDDETIDELISDEELEKVSVDDQDEDFIEEILLQDSFEGAAIPILLDEFEDFGEEVVLLSEYVEEIIVESDPEFVEEEIVGYEDEEEDDDDEYIEYVLEDAYSPSTRQRLPTLESIDEAFCMEEFDDDDKESALEELVDDDSDIVIEEFSTGDEFVTDDELNDELMEHALSTNAFFHQGNLQVQYLDEEGVIYEYDDEYVEFDFDSHDEYLDEDTVEDEEDEKELQDDKEDEEEEYWGIPSPRLKVIENVTEIEEIFEIVEADNTVEIIEEEIIPQFKVPIVPAIAAWQVQEEERELADPFALPPEEAPRTPMNIIMAVLAAASSDFKLRKVPEDHKQKYVPMADSAACLGRLTKLKETVVEAMGTAPLKKQDSWKPSGKPIALLRSNNVRIVNEAATVGRMMRLKETFVTNYNEVEFQKEEGELDIDDQVDERGFRIFRTSKLVYNHVRDAKQEAMARDWTLQCLEETAEAEETDLENVKLPSVRIPRFQPSPKQYNTAQELREALSRGVAEGAWDRKYRLERPQVKLRITSMCRCIYCQHPTAYQTHKYKRLSEAHREVQAATVAAQ